MKYLVVSDIHGALKGASAIKELEDFHETDAVLLLGDILYHGPRNDLPEDYAPKEVIPLISALKDRIIAVRGNCDAEVDQMVLGFPISADYNELFVGKHKVFMTHGHVYSPKNMPELSSGMIFLSGHTHLPEAHQKDGVFILNPGSISLPKGGHPCTYGILDKKGFKIFTLDHEEYMKISF